MKRRRLIFATLLSVLVSAVTVVGGDAGRQSPLSIGAGARGIGLGGGMSPLTGDASAVYYNPAGLGFLNYQEFLAQHTLLPENTIYDFGAWVYPLSDHGGIGIGYARIGTGDIVRRINFQDIGTFDYTESELFFSYGQRFDWFAAGLTLRVLNQKIDDLSDYGMGVDAGVALRIRGPLRASFVCRDAVPTQIRLISTSEKAPQVFVGGLGVDRLKLSEQMRLTASVTGEKASGREAQLHAGGEVSFYDLCAVRGGFDRNNLVIGAGIKAGRIGVDYAYKLQDALVDQHSFSLSFLIGASVEDRLRRRDSLRHLALQLDPHVVYLNALKDTANSYMHQFRLDSALAYFQKLYDEEPSNQEYIGTIAAIENAQRVQREQEERLRATQIEINQILHSYFDQARMFYDKKYYTAASDLLRLIFDIQPDDEAALVLQHEIRAAVARDIAAYTDSAKAAETAGNRIEIIEACDRILALDSTNRWAKDTRDRALAGMDIAKHLNIGIELFNKGQTAEAAKRFRSVLEARPGDLVALEYLKKIDASVSRVATLEDLQQDKAVWQLYLEGLRHMRDKEYDKAIEAWQKVLQTFPNQPNTLNNIDQARLRMKTEQTGK